jgi:hypothetical protein
MQILWQFCVLTNNETGQSRRFVSPKSLTMGYWEGIEKEV